VEQEFAGGGCGLLKRPCRVEFYDYNGAFLGARLAPKGGAAQAPPRPRPPKGWRFDHWEPQVAFVLSDTRATAVYLPKEYLVTFLSETGAVLKREYVPHGQDAAPPLYFSKTKGRAASWSAPTKNIRRTQVFCALFDGQVA